MYKILTTDKYYKFFKKLSNDKKVVIERRFNEIITKSYLGDYKIVERNLYELRIFTCGGIRIYFTIKDNVLIILLNGGFKESKEQQQKDIRDAKKELQNIINII